MTGRPPPEGAGWWTLKGDRDDAALEAVEPILRLPDARRFLLLTVVCPKNHQLVRVYGTGIGPVAIYQRREERGWELLGPDPDQPGQSKIEDASVQHRHRAGTAVILLSKHREGGAIVAQCRCATHLVYLGWLGLQLANNVRRAVWRDDPSDRIIAVLN